MDGNGLVATMQTDSLSKGLEDTETIDVGLEAVADDVGKAFFFGVHDHDGQCDAIASQLGTFVAVGLTSVLVR